MAFSSGASTKSDLVQAITEAVDIALESLPRGGCRIDLGIVSVSSLYDGGPFPLATTVVPAILAAIQVYNDKLIDNQQQPTSSFTLQNLMGSSVAGCIASIPTTTRAAAATASATDMFATRACQPMEYEGVPAVAITLCVLPDTNVKVFHVSASDLPDDPDGQVSAKEWKRIVGLSGVGSADDDDNEQQAAVATDAPPPPSFWLLPHPAFATDLDDFLTSLTTTYFSGAQCVGGIVSTVSSLSRAKLFGWSQSSASTTSCYADGCVGVALQGDVRLEQLTALGAKPVGGIYQIIKGQDATIQAIVLDETATDALQEDDEDVIAAVDESEDDSADSEERMTDKERLIASYAKARIPKPPLAEANFIMRTLSDDDQAFMRRVLLVGLDQGAGGIGRTASELARLAQGEGHRFTVKQVASGGMKDGSVTFPLGSVNIKTGTRMRFFVRESSFAKKEISALWTGYKKRLLDEQFKKTGDGNSAPLFEPAACFVIPTLDRGNKFFAGKAGYESNAVAQSLPGVRCIAGFFSNGVIGQMDKSENKKVGVQGSASSYILIGSRSNRPVYSPVIAAKDEAAETDRKAAQEAETQRIAAEDDKRQHRLRALGLGSPEAAPRSEDGELILKRREVHAGRALTVSTVEWSVAEKTAKPSSVLEGYMWDKETEVDRFRERVPLANLVSQCRLSANDPTALKPRDWIKPLRDAFPDGFVIIPEMKRSEPTTGSLRKKYDLEKLAKSFVKSEVPVLCVNCDQVLFGGSLEDVTTVRQTTTNAAIEQASEDGVVVPPILASDLLLYPYQLYKLRLAGADAVNLIVGALEKKDLIYLTKIASTLQLQTLVTVTSEAQLRNLSVLPKGSFVGIIVSNRELEDFSFDMTGEQALRLLRSDALRSLLEIHGSDTPVIVEGRVGIITRRGEGGEESESAYVAAVKEAGANAAIIGGGLAVEGSDAFQRLQTLRATA